MTNNLTGVELCRWRLQKVINKQTVLRELVFVTSRLRRESWGVSWRSDWEVGHEKDPLMSWIPGHAAKCVSRYRIMDDGRTPDQRRCGKTWKRPVVESGESVNFRPVGENNALRGGDQRLLRGVYVGHHKRSSAAIFLTPDSVKRGTRIGNWRQISEIWWDLLCLRQKQNKVSHLWLWCR